MKWLLCLFSLYILVLSGIPCQADDDCCIEETFANATHARSKEQAKHPAYPRPCSPFFACCACHGFLVPDAGLALQRYQPAPQQQNSFYQAAALPDFTRSIWQPPKSL